MSNYEMLSERQRAILRVIQEYSAKHGYPPTVRDIGEAVNISSTSVVNYNLNKLVKEGFLTRSGRVSRGIRLKSLQDTLVNVVNDVRASRNIVQIPMVGQIVAGKPAMMPGDDFGYHYDEDALIPVPSMLIGNSDPAQIYALTVNGHSMIDAMISDGDTVILKKQDTARNGEMVAVWLDERGETTLKHFFQEGEKVRLQPANPTMDPRR
jgi:repressor LexA